MTKASSAIETNPFQSITKIKEQSIGLIYSVLDGSDYQWIASENGLYGIQGDLTFKLTHEQLPTKSPISFVFEDIKKNLWVATHGDGIFLLDSELLYVDKFDESTGLSSDFINEIIYLDPNTILTASFGGIDKISITERGIERLDLEDKQNILAIEMLDSNIIFGHTNGVSMYSLKSEKVKEYPLFIDLSPTYVYSIVRGKDNSIYVGTTNGLAILSFKKQRLKLEAEIETEQPVSTILIDLKERIWIAAEKLFLFDTNVNQLTDSGFMTPYFENRTIKVIEDLALSKNGNVLIAGPIFGFSWLPNGFDSIIYPHDDTHVIPPKRSSTFN